MYIAIAGPMSNALSHNQPNLTTTHCLFSACFLVIFGKMHQLSGSSDIQQTSASFLDCWNSALYLTDLCIYPAAKWRCTSTCRPSFLPSCCVHTTREGQGRSDVARRSMKWCLDLARNPDTPEGAFSCHISRPGK